MNCKYCGAELVEGKPFCPSCGKSQIDEMPEEQAAPVEEKAAPAKAPAGKIALAVAAVVLVLALLIALVVGGMDKDLFATGSDETVPATEAPEVTEGTEAPPATVPADGNPDDVTCKGTYTVSDDEAFAAASTVVATMNGKELTNGQLQVYYWEEVYAFLQQYGDYAAYFGLDYTRPLDTQMCEVGEISMTWQQYFLESAFNTWKSYQSVALEAEENAFEMDADTRAYVDGLRAEMETMASENEYENVEALMLDLIGAGPTVDDYVKYIATYHEGYTYYSHIYDNTIPTAEEIEAYFTANEAAYAEEGITKDSGVYVDVRHILIMPEGGETGEDGYPVYTDEAWAAAEVEATKVYNEWKSGDLTETRFGQLAQTYSEDGSASTGGLYTGVAKGDMVANFDSWCFDAARQVGDHDLVKTQFGYHIMYFCGSTPIWYSEVEADWTSEKMAAIIPAAVEKYPAEIDYSAIKLGLIELG